MIEDKKEFYNNFSRELPGNAFLNKSKCSKDYDVYFDHFSKDALNEMHRYSTDSRFYDHFEFNPFVDISETAAYMDKLLLRMSGSEGSRITTYWLIRRKSDNYLIGTAGLIDLNFSRQSIEWGYGVDPELWGQGYILQIQEILKDFVFNVLGLNRIHGVTMANNKKTIESILATGMSHEGIAKEHYYQNGAFIDGWRYAITSKDYAKQNQSLILNKNISLENIIAVISSVLEEEDITAESSMENNISWDSLNHMLIMIALKEKLGLDLSPSDIADSISVKEIMNIVNSSV